MRTCRVCDCGSIPHDSDNSFDRKCDSIVTFWRNELIRVDKGFIYGRGEPKGLVQFQNVETVRHGVLRGHTGSWLIWSVVKVYDISALGEICCSRKHSEWNAAVFALGTAGIRLRGIITGVVVTRHKALPSTWVALNLYWNWTKFCDTKPLATATQEILRLALHCRISLCMVRNVLEVVSWIAKRRWVV